VGDVLIFSNTKVILAKGVAVGIAISKWAVDRVSSALLGSVACQHGDGDEASSEQKVDNDGDECEKGLASETARENDGEDGVYNTDTRDALNSLLPLWDGDAAVGLD
jgi:hypothetical protein